MMLSTSSLHFLLLLCFVAQIHGDAIWTIKAMDDSNHYSITIEELCHHADDFEDCRNFIGRLLIEMETEQEQSRRDGDGTLFTYHHLPKAKIRRRINEKSNSDEAVRKNNFRFYLINIGGATLSVSLV